MEIILLGNGHDECIDPTTTENRSLRISEGAHPRLVIVAGHDEVHLRLRSCILSMASEHDQLVQVRIILLIVGQWRDAQLGNGEAMGVPSVMNENRQSTLTFCRSFLSLSRAKITNRM